MSYLFVFIVAEQVVAQLSSLSRRTLIYFFKFFDKIGIRTKKRISFKVWKKDWIAVETCQSKAIFFQMNIRLKSNAQQITRLLFCFRSPNLFLGAFDSFTWFSLSEIASEMCANAVRLVH